MSPILKQVEERMAKLDAQFGRKRHPFVPFAPAARGAGLRLAVTGKLGIPNEFEARSAAKHAFARGEGSLAALLVCRTSAVVEQCLFGGVPGIRDSLVELAAFALIWADCVEVLSRPNSKHPGGVRGP